MIEKAFQAMKVGFESAQRALDFLKRHQIDSSPTHYEFALSYITYPASDLARSVDAQIDGGLRLTADVAAGLIARHLAPAREGAIDRREQVVARQSEELGTLTSDAHALTQSLGNDVGSAVQQAEGLPPGMEGLVGRLSQAERELADLRGEFAKIRDEIGRGDRSPADADRDELTQALSQSGASQVLARIAAHEGNHAVVMFSVDDLAGINRRFGNSVGDNVLNAFAATLRHVFEGGDLIRWTGNEFVVVVRDRVLTAIRLLTEEALIALAARRLKLRGSGEWIGVVTASAGIVTDQGDTVEILLDRARANVAIAATAGGNRAQG